MFVGVVIFSLQKSKDNLKGYIQKTGYALYSSILIVHSYLYQLHSSLLAGVKSWHCHFCINIIGLVTICLQANHLSSLNIQSYRS